MGIYKISDLYNRLCEMIDDGYDYANIYLLTADEESPESLGFEALEDSFSSVDFETVESCKLPEDYYYLAESLRAINPTDYCIELNFTYEEIATIKHAVDNALAYFKELLDDPTQPKHIIKDIKQASVDCRNLQAKLANFFKHLH